MRRLVRALGAAVVAAAVPAAGTAAGTAGATAAGPANDGFTIEDERITESSGLAASRAHPGVYWTHNDSDDGPYVYAIDGRTGETVATVTLTGIAPRDVEAVSVGPDGHVYVGDIGDNFGGRWPEVWIYRFAEPGSLADRAVEATRHTVRYADGPRDAESLAVHPVTGRVYIVSKHRDGGALYAGPEKLPASGAAVFTRVADIGLWATDAAFSPDGTRLAVRGYFGGTMYAWEDGAPRELGRLTVPVQRQGESVTFTPDGRTLLYGTEGERGPVRPMPLTEEQLPESAGEEKPERTGGEGAGDGSGAGDGGAEEDGDDGGEGNTTGLVLALAAGAVLLLALRRSKRRGGGAS
ncbi:esterase-like activity of phytase family protein [Streptomyces sp. CNQ085]|uniref:esterase-like activity of phytase family protein n=1 Tax=Streptomyces sp. CNQ085 TaxID=2886944 RepID=UPI001F512066|nr:esterase-like activity of phytase family protein [Streptomyces sp. CNQ085]MCI0385388.1 esterase-like activity of phytase family protein [Streptomyces sp. CNQ085]